MDIFHFYGIFPYCVLLKFEEPSMSAGILRVGRVDLEWAGVGKVRYPNRKLTPPPKKTMRKIL